MVFFFFKQKTAYEIVSTVRVAAPAEREPLCLAEDMDCQVLVAHAAIRRECDLVRPVSVHHRFAEPAFTIDHRPLRKWSPPALDATCRRTGKDAFTERRAAPE